MQTGIPSSNSCFSGSRFPLETLFNRDDHISFFGAAWLLRPSMLSCGRNGLIDVRAILNSDGRIWETVSYSTLICSNCELNVLFSRV